MEAEEKVPFERRSKRYKTKYFSALKDLLGEAGEMVPEDEVGMPQKRNWNGKEAPK